MNDKIEKLKKQYYDIFISEELDDVVVKVFFLYLCKKKFYIWLSVIVVVVMIFIIIVNVSSDVVNVMVKIFVFGKVVEVIIFDELK